MKTCDFSNAKIGDKVWDFIFGEGVIEGIENSSTYPIYVLFKGDNRKTYTLNGYECQYNINPTLFWQSFEIPDAAFQKPLPNIAVDTPLLVWDGDSNKYRRYFSHFTGNKVTCFNNGQTSWTTTTDVRVWDYYEIVNP